jgi:hypothetical protein
MAVSAVTRPFMSEAQRRKWQQLRDEGRVTSEQYDDRAARTGTTSLPERAAPRVRTVGPSRAPDAAKFGKTRY